MEHDGAQQTKGHGCPTAPLSGGVRSPAAPPKPTDLRWYNGQGGRKAPSMKCHPTVRRLFELADTNFISSHRLAIESGHGIKNIACWRAGINKPSFHAVVDMYNALGYDLVPVKRGEQ